MTDRQVLTMLAALCTATFFVTSSGVSAAPFLNQITQDLASSLPAVAHLFSGGKTGTDPIKRSYALGV